MWMHKLRRAMVVPERDPLTGAVEIDETFVGGISRGNTGRSSDTVPVMVAAESLGKHRIGRIRLEPTPEGRLTLIASTQRVVTPGAMIKTDGAGELRRLSGGGFEHQYFTRPGSTIPAHIDLPAVHRVASLLKRWMIGTMHYGASREQFAYYLDEFTFRFNRRTPKSRGLLFYRLMQQAVSTAPHPMKSLVIPKT